MPATDPITLDIQNKPLEQLLFDPENPRLASVGYGTSQQDLLKALYSEMAIDEIAWSISENGFFAEEPLLVVPARTIVSTAKATEYVVIEGNRRLAAALLLSKPALRRAVKAEDLPVAKPTRIAELSSLPVVVYKDRKSLWQYLGFRHINGVKPWDPFSKAHYVAEVHEKYRIPLATIADKIGDRHSTVARLYRGYTVLRQAEQLGFNKDDRIKNRFSFSHLYTAVGYQEFLGFLGTSEEKSLKPHPIPLTKKHELIELMSWLYGSKEKDTQPIIRSQNPDLNHLKEVVGNAAALANLRSSKSLKLSYEISLGDIRRFEDAVYQAQENLKRALGVALKGFNQKDAELAIAIKDIAALVDELQAATINKSRKRA